jgi:hypothetical protein
MVLFGGEDKFSRRLNASNAASQMFVDAVISLKVWRVALALGEDAEQRR